MNSKLLATSALVAALSFGLASGPAPAQEQQAPPEGIEPSQRQQQQQEPLRPDVRSGAGGTSATTAPGGQTTVEQGGGSQPIFSNLGTGYGGSAGHNGGFYEADTHLVLTSALIGQQVRNLNGQEVVGTVTDLVLGGDGTFLALVVAAGGKEIAVDHREVTWMQFEPGRPALAMNAAAGRLENAPAFDRAAILGAGAGRSGGDPMNQNPAAPVVGEGGQLQDPSLLGGADNMDDGTRPVAAQPQTIDGFPVTGAAQPQQRQGTSNLQPGTTQQALTDAQTPQSEITSEDLVGMTVFGAEGEDIGSVHEVVVSPDGAIEALVIDAGGFLGLGSHSVAVDFASTNFVENNGMRAIQVGFTEDQLRGQPAYSEESYGQGSILR